MVIDARCKRTIRDIVSFFAANYHNRTRNCKWNHSFALCSHTGGQISRRYSRFGRYHWKLPDVHARNLQSRACCALHEHAYTHICVRTHTLNICVHFDRSRGTWKPIDNGVRVRENKEGSPHMSLRPSFLDVNGLSRWPMERELILVVCLQAVFMNVRGI